MGHLHNGILFGHKKKVLFVTAWMDLENMMLSEISPSEKDKRHMISLMGESNEHTKQAKQRRTHRWRAG